MNLLYLTILLPLIGFALLAFSRGRWSENLSATVGVGSITRRRWSPPGSASISLTGACAVYPCALDPMHVGNFNIGVTLTLDGLSFTMLSVVTGVGFFIHMFASPVYAWGRGLLALLRLYQPVYRQHGGSGAGR